MNYMEEKNMKKLTTIIAIMLVAVFSAQMVFAQGGGEAAAAPAAEKKDGPVEVLLWSAVSGSIANCLQQTVDEFNASQDKYFVNVEYQGGYMDIYTKLTTTLNKEDLPDMAIVSTELCGTYRLTPELLAPLSDFWKADEEPWGNLNGALKAIWGDANGNPSCFPMGNSFYGQFVNADIFAAAGIDPYEALTSVKGLYETCKKLVDGGFCKYGASLDSWGGFVWYGLAAAGVQFMDNGNGHLGDPTKILISTPEVRAALYDYFYYFRKMQQENLIVPYGSSWGDESLPAFATKQCAICTGSIAAFNRVEKAMADAPFALAWVPCWSAVDLGHAPDGYAASGTGFCVINSGNKEAMQGAADFIAYSGSVVPQVRLDMNSGYLPINEAVLNSAEYQEFVTNRFPAAKRAFEIQQAAAVDYQHTNALNPINNACQSASAAAWSKVMSDFDADINAVIDEMQTTLQDALDLWNATK